jgi:2'-5' RNA ligase
VRCFVGVRLSAPADAALAEVIERLRRGDTGVRWVASANLHATLKFLGEVADVAAASAALAAIAVPALRLGLDGLGCFPDARRPRVLWAGLHGDVGALGAFARACEDALAVLGFAREERAFHPHVTIGRIKSPLAARALAERLPAIELRTPPAPVREVALYRSTRGPRGSVYEVVARLS